jgi:ferritin-like metal-binding protein YciE
MADQLKEQGLRDFFIQCLQDLYIAEKKLVNCAAALSIAAFTEELQRALIAQSEEAVKHAERLETVFAMMNQQPGNGKCDIIEILSDKAASIVKTVETGTALRDAAIIYAAQLIAHYKIASYGSLISLLAELDYPKAKLILKECLADERAADAYLTQIAVDFINPAAKRESE